jgi:hypothetical protein
MLDSNLDHVSKSKWKKATSSVDDFEAFKDRIGFEADVAIDDSYETMLTKMKEGQQEKLSRRFDNQIMLLKTNFVQYKVTVLKNKDEYFGNSKSKK